MDWDFSIERNRGMLLPHIVGLFAMIGLVEGGTVERVSRPLYRKVAGLLRSAESAVRRLIIVMARDIVVEPRPKRPMPAALVRSRKGTFQSNGSRQRQWPRPKPREKTPQALLQLVRPGKARRFRPSPPPPAQVCQSRAPHSCPGLRSADSGAAAVHLFNLSIHPRTCSAAGRNRQRQHCQRQAPVPPSLRHHACADAHGKRGRTLCAIVREAQRGAPATSAREPYVSVGRRVGASSRPMKFTRS